MATKVAPDTNQGITMSVPKKKKQVPLLVNTEGFTPDESYVCWVDIMGTKNFMRESFEKAANFILRFHLACTKAAASEASVRCYPLMDGAFLTATELDKLKKVINVIYQELATHFIETDACYHLFVIRGSIAKGELAHGENITPEICGEIAGNDSYKKNLLFGLPMIQAFKAEEFAPPFGVYIHESARKMDGIQGRYYHWCSKSKTKDALKNQLQLYFSWCRLHSPYLKLDKSKISHYEELVEDYFSNSAISTVEFSKTIKQS